MYFTILPVIPSATQWKPITNYITATHNIFYSKPNTIHETHSHSLTHTDTVCTDVTCNATNRKNLIYDCCFTIRYTKYIVAFLSLSLSLFHSTAANLSDPLQIMNAFTLLKVSCCSFGWFYLPSQKRREFSDKIICSKVWKCRIDCVFSLFRWIYV